MTEATKLKAHDKAFSKIHALQIRVSKLKYDIERKKYWCSNYARARNMS